MLVSLKWLNQYIKIDDLDPQELADKISLYGAEVEQVKKVSDATGIVIGYVEKKEQHPDADKLSVCQVNLGEEIVQIVCGAPNVDAGQKVPVATNGAMLPGGFEIKKTKLRGQESNGMICSASELGVIPAAIPDASGDGIWILPQDAPIGEDAIRYLGLDDTVIELGLTPNRMDLLSMYGVANDVAAILDRKVTPFPKTADLQKEATDFSITLATKKCQTYLAKLVENVTIEPSDVPTQAILMATGNKPISNIVDLTNKIMLQTGLPIHAFDADKLPSKNITVREAKDGETVITLDGTERKLEAGDILITSGDKIVAIAGVMGSASATVDEQTKNILFEAAIFDTKQIRKTAARLNLRTNASARFEKGIHPERIFEASAIIDATFTKTINIKAGTFEDKKIIIDIEVDEINNKLGTKLDDAKIAKILKRLNLEYEKDETKIKPDDFSQHFKIYPNNRMLDVTQKHDIIEEIARIHGFNNIPSTLPEMNTAGSYTKKQSTINNLHRVAQAAGLQNVVTYSLVNEEKLYDFLPTAATKADAVSLSMPLSLDHAHLRKSLIPSLLEVLTYNNARQMKNIFIYEIGKTHAKNGDDYLETTLMSGALTGEVVTSKWQAKREEVDFYLAKGAVDALIESLGFSATYEKISDNYPDFHPGQSATIAIDSQIVGVIGKLHPKTKKAYEINDTFVFELDLDAIFALEMAATNYEPVSKYPGISFDIAIITSEILPASALVDTIKKAGGKLLKEVEVFDIYTGVGVEEKKKSVAINLYYQDSEKTLTDEDVNPIHEKVLAALEKEHNATLRQ